MASWHHSILILLSLLVSPCYVQTPDCANSYTPADLPNNCTGNVCTFSNLTQLIVQDPLTFPFTLCFDMPGVQITISNNNDTIDGPCFITAANLTFTSANATFSSTPTSGDVSIFNLSDSIFISSTNLSFISAELQVLNNIQLVDSDLEVNLVLDIALTSQNGLLLLNNSWIGTQNLTLFGSYFTLVDSQLQYDGYLYALVTTTVLSNSSIGNDLPQCNSLSYCDSQEYPPPPIPFPRAWNSGQYNLSFIASYNQTYFLTIFNFILISNYSIIVNNGSGLYAGIMAIYSQSLSVDAESEISSDFLGCLGGTGAGCGYYEDLLSQLIACSGTGGSHGGLGGNSTPQSCSLLLPKPVYGSITFPMFTGSGGGVSINSNHSAGGGMVYIQVLNLTLEGVISANGQNAVLGGGGGGGGGINIHVQQAAGNGQMLAQGGGSKSSGGGGRIALVINNTIASPTTNNIQWSVNAGGECTQYQGCGQPGTFYRVMCPPGYEPDNYACSPCPNGTFKSTFGYSQCMPCTYNPPYSYYEQTGMASPSLCTNFKCVGDYVKSKQGKCVTKLMNSINPQINLLISLAMILTTVVGYAVVVLCMHLFSKGGLGPSKVAKEMRAAGDTNLKLLAQKPQFQIEEMPYHELRIYLEGTNKPQDPWRLNRNCFSSVTHSFVRNIKFDQLISDINQAAKYCIWQKTLLWVLKIYYYPLYYYTQQKLKEAKSKSLQKIVRKFRKEVPDWEQVTIKLTVKPNCQVACIEVFNYKRDLFDFYIENTFPVAFVLEKRLLGGYFLDFQDPFLRALTSHIDNKFKDEQDAAPGPTFEKYCRELDQLLMKLPDIDPLISHLASADRFNLQLYLFQPPDNVLNYDPKDQFNPKKELILVVVEQMTTCRHFYTSNPLPDFKYLEIDRLRWQLSRKHERTNIINLKWEKPNHVQKKVLNWILWVINIVLFLNQLAVFVLFITRLTNNQKDSCSEVALFVLYFAMLPLVELMTSAMILYWTIKPVFRPGVYSVLMTFGNLIKSLALAIYAIVGLFQCGVVSDTATYMNYMFLGNTVLLCITLQCERWMLWVCRHS